MAKKSGLGRGLSALIPKTTETADPSDRYEELSVDRLDPNPEQPRHYFHEEQLRELADSIQHNGVIQPIIVTPSGPRYIVIAGERRWRATLLAGFEKIPAIVRKIDKEKMLSVALLENIQRQELNPIEEALAYSKLLESNNFTHEKLANSLGKSRVTITNTTRLLKLPTQIKNLIQDEKLSFGHARCLVTVEDKEQLLKLAVSCLEKQWSVRELEKRIQALKNRKKRTKPQRDQSLTETAKKLGAAVNGKVSIVGDAKKGKIAFTYNTEREYQTLVQYFLNKASMEK